ncbi:MAG: DUF5723 family protein [Flavobacteriales bacterium]|nr:DUF5723 family protein [Flavobacteriales bacterium]
MTEIKKIAFILPVLFMFGQPQFNRFFIHKYSTQRRALGVYSFGELGSTSVNIKFLNSFFTGQFINDELKNSVRHRLGDHNRFGIDWSTEISFLNMHDSLLGKNWGFYAAIKNRVTAEGSFSRNAFELPFYGNTMFAGDTAYLSDTRGRLFMYQQFQLGFVKTWTRPKSSHVFGIALSYLNGNNLLEANFNQMNVYTDAQADYLQVQGNGYLYRNNPEYSRFFTNNGSGLSVDLQYQAQLGNGFISIQVQDLGFISWERPGDWLTMDTTFRFNGITINNIFTTDGSEFSNFLDSINTYYIKHTNDRPGFRMLPSRFHLAYTHFLLNGKLMLQAGVQARITPYYFPQVYVQGTYYPHSRIMVGTSIGYGGFGTLNIGLDAGVDFGKGYTLILQTRNVEGIVPNTFATGLSAGIKFSRMF